MNDLLEIEGDMREDVENSFEENLMSPEDIAEFESWLDVNAIVAEVEYLDDGEPIGSFDLSDDAEALASAGMGTDEDYGSFGSDDF